MIVFLKREHNIHLMEMQSTESKKFKYKPSQNKSLNERVGPKTKLSKTV